MKMINIFKQVDNGLKYQINFDDKTGSGQSFGFSITLSVEDMRLLGKLISEELEDLGKPEEEVVWNPRSQRHERVIKK